MIVCKDKVFKTKEGKLVQGFYMDQILKENIDSYFIRAVKNDYDGICVVSGTEGVGKTSFTTGLACYCDNSFPFDCSRIVFNERQIHNAIDNADKGQAIVLDEAILSMGSQDAASEIQKVLIKKFTTIRKKNLYIFIIIPSFFMLRKYFAIFRTRFLIHCYTPDGVARGYWKIYNRTTKRQLYIRGLHEMDMMVVRANYRGRFTNTYGYHFDPVIYERKKDEAIASLSEDPFDKYRKEYKAKYDKAVATLDEYKQNLKSKYSMLLHNEKAAHKMKIKDFKQSHEEYMRRLKDDLAKIRAGKRDGMLMELVDFRDKMLWHLYKDSSIVNASEDLRNNGIIKLTPAAISQYLERGKSLLALDNEVNKYKPVAKQDMQSTAGG